MIVSEIDPSRLYSSLVQQAPMNNSVLTMKPLESEENDTTSKAKDTTFVETLKSFVNDVDMQKKEADAMTEALIKGEPVDLHDVMISAEKAKTTFTLLMEVRNKFLDVYRETLRMQV